LGVNFSSGLASLFSVVVVAGLGEAGFEDAEFAGLVGVVSDAIEFTCDEVGVMASSPRDLFVSELTSSRAKIVICAMSNNFLLKILSDIKD
jgi:hypothetical protein